MKCSTETKKGLFKTMASVQDSVAQACQSYFQRFRRSTHVTPKSFLNFISSYKDVYTRKQEEIGDMSSRMDNGLVKLLEAAESVAELSKELTVMEKELEVANQKADKVLVEVTTAASEAERVKAKVMKTKEACEKVCAMDDNDASDLRGLVNINLFRLISLTFHCPCIHARYL